VLSQKGHPGAQAFLADLLWRGKYMKADPVRALALISVAVANAPPYERVWIEDIYQNIYCGTGQGIRKQATGLVADWRTRYGRKPDTSDRSGLGPLDAQAIRTCRNGESVPFDMMGVVSAEAAPPVAATAESTVRPFLKGPAGVGLRDVGAKGIPAPAN
jgi:exopolysaccharide production negative regulator